MFLCSNPVLWTNLCSVLWVLFLNCREEDISEIQNELSLLRLLRSENIIQYYGAAMIPGTTKLHVVMELAAISAADLVKSLEVQGQKLSEPSVAYIIRETLNALVYLHAERHMHRDVRASNILLSRGGDVKVSDFGAAANLGRFLDTKHHTFVGSPLWMAPEIIEEDPDIGKMSKKSNTSDAKPDDMSYGRKMAVEDEDGYDEAADIWSLGITAIELAQGQPPRADVPVFRALFQIVKDAPPKLDPSMYSEHFQDFISQCLQKDPLKRSSAIDLLMHPFVANAEKPSDLEEQISVTLNDKVNDSQNRYNFDDNKIFATSFADKKAREDVNWNFDSVKVDRNKPIAERENDALQTDNDKIENGVGYSIISNDLESEKSANTFEQILKPALMKVASSSEQHMETKDQDRISPTECARNACSSLEKMEGAVPGSTRAIMLEMASRLQVEATSTPALADLVDAIRKKLHKNDLNTPLNQTSSESNANEKASQMLETSKTRNDLEFDLGPLGNFLVKQWQNKV